jgi:NHLM bacteriocin system ABC transporter ATP-binding protein
MSPRPTLDLETLFAAEGAPRPAGGNTPVELAEGDVFRVERGSIELFATAGEGAVRWHAASFGPGSLLFGTERAAGLTLTAVGTPDTVLRHLSWDRLAGAVGSGGIGGLGGLAKAAEPWLAALLAALAGRSPKKFQELEVGGRVACEEGETVVRPRQGLLWVRQVEGVSRFLGEPGLELRKGELLPLPEAAWLTLSGPGVVAAEAAEAAPVSAPWLAAALGRFHELFLHYAAGRLAARQEEERARLARRAGIDRERLEGAYARLASVLAPRGESAAEAAASEPLLAACRLVGRRLGIDFVPLRDPEGRVRAGDRLTALCAANRVRHRRVILRDDWWRRDNGPLLAFRTSSERPEERRPVALLPTSPSSYELLDPTDPTDPVNPANPVGATPRAVDAALAEELAGDAFMFYPPLPERPLHPGDLLRLAFSGRRRDLGTIVLVGLAGGLLGLLTPILTGQIFGSIIPGADRSQLLQVTLALGVAALATTVFQVVRSLAVLRLSGKIDGSVQAAVWDRLLALPTAFFRRYSVGDLASRSLGIDAIRQLVTGNVLTSVLSTVFSVLSFALLFYYSWRLALLATGLVAVLLLVTTGLLFFQVRHQRELLALEGKISSLLFGLIGGLAKLRIAGAEQRAYALWAERFAEQRRVTVKAQRLANVQLTVSAVFGLLSSLAVFAMVGFTSEAQMPIGRFLAFNAAFAQFLGSALSMIGFFSTLLTLVPLYERLSPILKERPEVDPSKVDAGDLAGEIELSHVSFRYREDGPLILDDVSLRARPGEFIALVGPSGAGKSTCLRLLLGFEKPTAGSIYFDGQDLSSLNLLSVRRQLGVVLQSGRPMTGDILSVIIGNANLGIDDAWEAARLAGMEDDIKAMPMGMHTVIGEGAETFSGGQRQRLLIARAIVNRPRILFFDEATSALDNRTQELVSRSLEGLKATRIVVAHRLSTIVNADRIYVFAQGRVVESGTYRDLLAQGGLFSQLAARQIA